MDMAAKQDEKVTATDHAIQTKDECPAHGLRIGEPVTCFIV
jgi:hypothetical protein